MNAADSQTLRAERMTSKVDWSQLPIRHLTKRTIASSIEKTPAITKIVMCIIATLAILNLFRHRDLRVWIFLLVDAAPLFVLVPGRGWPRALLFAAATDLVSQQFKGPVATIEGASLVRKCLRFWAGLLSLGGAACAVIICAICICFLYNRFRPTEKLFLLLFAAGLLCWNLSVSAFCLARSKGRCGFTVFGTIHCASLLLAVHSFVSLFLRGDNLISADASGVAGLLMLLSCNLYWQGWRVESISEDALLAKVLDATYPEEGPGRDTAKCDGCGSFAEVPPNLAPQDRSP